MHRLFLVLAIVSFLAFLAPLSSASASHPDDVKIVGGDFGWFCSFAFFNGVCETEVQTGATVTWNISAGIRHSVTECGADCDLPTATPLWDSGLMFSPFTFEFQFDTPGVYKYYCRDHPLTMRGQITVSGSVGGVAEIDGATGAGLDASEPVSGASAVATAIAIATAAALVAGLIGVVWFTRRRLG